jgi:hypothetical protein
MVELQCGIFLITVLILRLTKFPLYLCVRQICSIIFYIVCAEVGRTVTVGQLLSTVQLGRYSILLLDNHVAVLETGL